ncbi:MAG: hypothetical protein IJY74_00330, partial [Oscillospiraceae bacterium]|nr:hypothetical protein [Oscillospiraceae bacterium]
TDKITSEKVIYMAVEGGFLLSLRRTADASNHINEFNEKSYELYNEYGSSVPTSDIENLYDSVDSVALSELDEGLMNEILAVFGCE